MRSRSSSTMRSAVFLPMPGMRMSAVTSPACTRRANSSTPAPDILHDAARDATTLPLLREALRQSVPVFAICRGIQELNVAMGGSLHQFLHQVEGKRDHRSDKTKQPGERAGPVHFVTLTPGGVLQIGRASCRERVWQ